MAAENVLLGSDKLYGGRNLNCRSLGFANGTTAAPSIYQASTPACGISFPSTNNITFSTGGAERAIIDSLGKMFVGVDINFGQVNNAMSTSLGIVRFGNIPVIAGIRANGTSAAPTTLLNGATMCALEGRGYDGVAYSGNQAGLRLVTSQDWAEGKHGAAIQFITTANDATTATVRGNWNNSGNLFLGSDSTATNLLQLGSDSAGKPSTNTWTIVSDQRIKENIENADLKQCYDDVKAVQLRRFRWRDDIYDDENIRGDRHQLGFIAQEVELINPKSVETVPGETVFKTKRRDENGELVKDEDGNQLYDEVAIENLKQLNDSQLLKSLWGAVQKLIEKVEALENA